MVSMPLASSPHYWYGLHAVGMISMRLAWSLCLWPGVYAFDMIPHNADVYAITSTVRSTKKCIAIHEGSIVTHDINQ